MNVPELKTGKKKEFSQAVRCVANRTAWSRVWYRGEDLNLHGVTPTNT